MQDYQYDITELCAPMDWTESADQVINEWFSGLTHLTVSQLLYLFPVVSTITDEIPHSHLNTCWTYYA